jgi:hypothetical protein
MINCRKQDNLKGKQHIATIGTMVAACHVTGNAIAAVASKSEPWKPMSKSEPWKPIMTGFKIDKIRRESNQAAHELAKLAKYFVFNSFWMGCVPAEFVSIVQTDAVKKLKLSSLKK